MKLNVEAFGFRADGHPMAARLTRAFIGAGFSGKDDVLRAWGGSLPSLAVSLLRLPGVGRDTAKYAFDAWGLNWSGMVRRCANCGTAAGNVQAYSYVRHGDKWHSTYCEACRDWMARNLNAVLTPFDDPTR